MRQKHINHDYKEGYITETQCSISLGAFGRMLIFLTTNATTYCT